MQHKIKCAYLNKSLLIFFKIFFLTLCNHISAEGINKNLLEKYLPNNPVIIEAGAHGGFDTVELALRWPQGKIYAFEPVPTLFKELLKKTIGFHNVFCSPLALSSISGFAQFHISGGTSDGSSSLLTPHKHLDFHPSVSFNQTIIVQTITLDEWAQQNKITQIDCLWLDLQGSELEVLKASPKILQTVKVIHTEVSLIELYKGVPLYSEIRTWLGQQGFSVVKEDIPWQDAGNVLFVRA